jgi:hypothetical protein
MFPKATPDSSERLTGAATAVGRDACGEAVERAIASLGREAGLVLIFPTGDMDPRTVAAEATEAAAGARVAGMTGTGAIGVEGLIETGCAAIAFASSVPTAVGAVESGDPRGDARDAVGAVLAETETAPYRVVLLFVDSESGDQAEIVAGAYGVAGGRIPLAGGAAGGGARARFADRRALSGGVVAVALGSTAPIGVGIAHGCIPRGAPSIVTQSHGPNLVQLDGRPAQDVYFERLGVDGEEIDAEAFEVLAMLHPLAEPELGGAVRPRYIRARGLDGALVCATSIARNAAVEICDQTPETIIESAGAAVEDAVRQLEAPCAAAVVFDCAARSAWFRGALAGRELEALVAAFGSPSPSLAGVCTRGEIGRARGAKGDRNHSVVVVALSAPD